MKPFLAFLFALHIITNLHAQSANDYYKEAETYRTQKEFTKALTSINKALHLDTAKMEYYIAKTDVQLDLKKYDDAYFTLCKAITVFPKKAELYDRRATLLGSMSEADAAIEDYNKAIEYAETDTLRYMSIANRATAKIGKRDFEGAYQDLMTAYKFDTTQIAVLVNLGAVADESGRGDQTLMFLHKALALDSGFVGSWGNIGFKYLEMGEYKKAITYFNKVLELQPDEALGYNNRAYCKLKLKDPAGALKDVNKSIELYPGNSYAYRNRALIHIDQKRIKLACEDLQMAITQGFTERYGDEVEKLLKQYCDAEKGTKTL